MANRELQSPNTQTNTQHGRVYTCTCEEMTNTPDSSNGEEHSSETKYTESKANSRKKA